MVWGKTQTLPLLVWQELLLPEAHVTSNNFLLMLVRMGR